MFTLKRKPLSIPSADQALPGRPEAIPTAASHFISGAPLKGPYPEGSQMALFALGCFWGAERKYWQLPGVTVTAVGYVAGSTPTPRTRRFAPAARATRRRCSWSSTRSR